MCSIKIFSKELDISLVHHSSGSACFLCILGFKLWWKKIFLQLPKNWLKMRWRRNKDRFYPIFYSRLVWTFFLACFVGIFVVTMCINHHFLRNINLHLPVNVKKKMLWMLVANKNAASENTNVWCWKTFFLFTLFTFKFCSYREASQKEK